MSTKYVTYTGATICGFPDKTVLMACGLQSANKYVVSEFNMISGDQSHTETFVHKHIYI